MSDVGEQVHCERHGPATATFVCQHLVRGSGLGFFSADDPADSYPDAWCGQCEEVRVREGGEWNDSSEAFAKVTLLCHHCYEMVRSRNQTAKQAPTTDRPRE
ncbi:MAG TPA: hypothetical protein VH643_23555 [Gemmataceae bacterium]|jgi:hypothetical protein